jgi:DNA replication and repair protein RecF
MWLKKINLFNFRNFYEKSFNFNPFITIILGENAKGKTNLLEATVCLSSVD